MYRFGLNIKNIENRTLNPIFEKGYYFLIKYEFEITKLINGRKNVFNHLKSMVINLNGEEFTIPEKEDAENFSAICQQFKTNMPEEGFVNFNKELMNAIREKYSEFIIKEKKILEENEKLKFESELNRKTKQEIDYLDNKINKVEEYIEQNKGVEATQRAEIKKFEEKKNKLIEANKKSKLTIKSKLISLNLIYLYG